jgi:hypothetical protein
VKKTRDQEESQAEDKNEFVSKEELGSYSLSLRVYKVYKEEVRFEGKSKSEGKLIRCRDEARVVKRFVGVDVDIDVGANVDVYANVDVKKMVDESKMERLPSVCVMIPHIEEHAKQFLRSDWTCFDDIIAHLRRESEKNVQYVHIV